MSVKTAIMETRYAAERRSFEELLREKATQLARLDSVEYFHSPDYHPVRTQRQIARLEREVQILTGYMMGADQVIDAHEEEMALLALARDRREAELVRCFAAEIRKRDRALTEERDAHAYTQHAADTFTALFYEKMNYKDEQNSSDGPTGGL